MTDQHPDAEHQDRVDAHHEAGEPTYHDQPLYPAVVKPVDDAAGPHELQCGPVGSAGEGLDQTLGERLAAPTGLGPVQRLEPLAST